ncbi:Oxoglutarate/iron-dependent dioxygenase [Corchorus olitorius]|uniref:Oxoglutarate/iron-dependent dioxygenase n=1 Tax=Corchorus olitorius TaxID=93759 RepID=A0A1R3H3Q9_9ROSI|nr:Oxoglutarate/iron-dependent dioxygenase [Corchorus olitorius]
MDTSYNQNLARDPPFHETYKTLISNSMDEESRLKITLKNDLVIVEECELLPLIDLSPLFLDDIDELQKEGCKEEIARAAHEWGFFQVVNHGISRDILENMREEQVKVFKQPFETKLLNFSAGSYRWGTPNSATSIRQLSWSEAFHIPSSALSPSSSSLQQFATEVASLAQELAEILAEKIMGHKSSTYFQENCLPSTCYLRLNRYPPCPIASQIFGLMPHTDSDFLTILHQDQVGGLQLEKDGKWVAVKPNPEALIINIGDLFQAWSNGYYKSVQHCVVTNPTKERFSAAYFLCPSCETVIESCSKPSIY